MKTTSAKRTTHIDYHPPEAMAVGPMTEPTIRTQLIQALKNIALANAELDSIRYVFSGQEAGDAQKSPCENIETLVVAVVEESEIVLDRLRQLNAKL